MRVGSEDHDAMRIGIMLRHIDQHGGGVRVYTHNLMRELLALNTPHEFFLLYQNPRLLGTFANGERVREIALEMSSKFLWDQIAVRRAEKRYNLDLIFNPKYSVPLGARCPTVFVCHGLDWYVEPRWSKRIDRMNHRLLIPRYARKAETIIAVSNTTRQHVLEYLKIDGDRVRTVYLGVGENFLKPVPEEELARVRKRYRLPERFFLYVGQIYPPKNFGRLVQAYARVGPQHNIHLVVAGEHRWLSDADLALIDKLGLSGWVVRTGWIGHDVLPALYRRAEALLLPSLYEACPSPILEAMASGCPIVTADRYGTREIAGDAAVLVDPERIDSIAAGIGRVAADRALRERLIAAGAKRVREFSWQKCAHETLRVLESAARAKPSAGPSRAGWRPTSGGPGASSVPASAPS